MAARERVIVIGGGLAGLSAAEALLRRGVEVLLLEARPRLGGRVLTRRDAAVPWPVELGAELIEEAEGPLVRAAREGGAVVQPWEGEVWVRREEALVREPRLGGILAGAIARACPPSGADLPLELALAERLRGAEEGEARRLVRHYVEGYHAADLARVSARWVAKVEGVDCGGAAASQELGEGDGFGFLVAGGGLDLAVERLAREALAADAVRLNAEVAFVTWDPGRVEVRTRAGAVFQGRAAVVTLPHPLLLAEAVVFDPPLRAKRAALAALATGSVVKLVLRCDRLPGPLGEGGPRFLFAPGQPFSTFWTPATSGAPLIVAWAGGPAARRLAGHAPRERASAANQALARALGISRGEVERHLRAVHTHDWDADRFARGAYSWVPAGACAAPEELARPLAGTLFFAGEATCGGGANATMEGAIASGRRAAAELLAG